MGKRTKLQTGIAVFLLSMLFHALFLGGTIKVSSASKEQFAYVTDTGETGKTQNWNEAISFCRKNGGTITLQRSIIFEQSVVGNNANLEEKCILVIPKGVTLTLNNMKFFLDGDIIVKGVLNLRNGGVLEGDGRVLVNSGGVFYKASYEMEKNGDVCLQGNPIIVGQSLADSVINSSHVMWKASVPGVWTFACPSLVPEVGTGLFDVTFTPDNSISYDAATYPVCGQVEVNPTPTPLPTPSPAPTPTPVSIPISALDSTIEPSLSSNSTLTEQTVEGLETSILAETSSETVSLEDGQQKEKVVVVTKMASVPSTLTKTVKKTFSQKRPVIQKGKRRGKSLQVAWKKVSGASGYQVSYSYDSSMKKAKMWEGKGCRVTLKKIKKGKPCYVRVRAYKKGKKKRTYTKWSSISKFCR